MDLGLSYVVLEAVTLCVRVAVTLVTDVGVVVTVIDAGVSMHAHTASTKDDSCDFRERQEISPQRGSVGAI